MSQPDRSRREFLKAVGLGAASVGLPPWLFTGCESGDAAGEDPGRPNILWISVEDMSPDLGCYGDSYAVTPNLDRFAAEGTRFANAFANAGVCAPARSCIITGMYPTSIGTNNMRCEGVPPDEVKCFPEYLRAAGYFCTNRQKTDYNFPTPPAAWDQCSSGAHWRNRAPGQPFFSVFNITTTHESQIRASYTQLSHEPDLAELPPYYPDTPVVRQDWARYCDLITMMDAEAQATLQELEDDGLAEDTIVWFWSDHGRGLPRAKRWIYDAGVHVPLIVRVPERFRRMAGPGGPFGSLSLLPGTVNEDLVSFVDFAPTVLSLAGVAVPGHMQGRPFLGRERGAPRRYVFAARDRMDEAYDLIRAARDGRFKYIRNFMPHVTYGQDIDYMNQMPTMQEMRRLNAEGKLVGAETLYFLPTKPVEELYDTLADPHEVDNLAGGSEYDETLQRMRGALGQWMDDTRDVGLVPEPEFDEMTRPGGVDDPGWRETLDRTDLLDRLQAIKALDGQGAEAIPGYLTALADADAPVRYWAVVGLHVVCTDPASIQNARASLLGRLADGSPSVRVAAAQALCDWGDENQALPVLVEALKAPEKNVRLYAITALGRIGEKARPALPDIQTAMDDPYDNVQKVAKYILLRLQ